MCCLFFRGWPIIMLTRKSFFWDFYVNVINLMENILKILCDIIYSRIQPRNIKELREKLFEAIDAINKDKRYIIKNTYSTFKERLTKFLITKRNLCNWLRYLFIINVSLVYEKIMPFIKYYLLTSLTLKRNK